MSNLILKDNPDHELKLQDYQVFLELLLSTPRQLCIVLLKATGNWKD